MSVDACFLYLFRHNGLTIFQMHAGYDKKLGVNAYLVVMNILLFDIIVYANNPLRSKEH